jgi:hypothetical protein
MVRRWSIWFTDGNLLEGKLFLVKRLYKMFIVVVALTLFIVTPLHAAVNIETAQLSKRISGLLSFVAIKDDWIYYYPSFGYKPDLYRMHYDGSSKEVVKEPYYINSETYSIEFFEKNSFLDKVNGKGGYIYRIIDDWVYFLRAKENDEMWKSLELYRAKKDGSQEIKLLSLNDGNLLKEGELIRIEGDWIYIKGFYKKNVKGISLYNLYRIPTIGGKSELIINGFEELRQFQKLALQDNLSLYTFNNYNRMSMTKDAIIYGNAMDNNYLYKSSLDGKNKIRLAPIEVSNEGFSSPINIDEDFVYFHTFDRKGSTIQNGGKLYRVRMDGTKLKQLGNDHGFMRMAKDGWFYYESKDGICRIGIDGTKKQILASGSVGLDDVVGDWIVYSKYSEFGTYLGTYRMKIDGSGKELLRKK